MPDKPPAKKADPDHWSFTKSAALGDPLKEYEGLGGYRGRLAGVSSNAECWSAQSV